MAAGQGFKTFTTGEVLTAGDVNGYLMQGVLVFASAAARNAAITSPQEGQFAFTKDTNGLWYYDGAAWVASGATGDIEGVNAGVGITGGGTSGTVTITNDMATTITASGDIVVGTGSGTYDNLPIGTTGQVLTADTTVSPYKVKWATASASSGPAFSAYKSADQTTAATTFEKVTFNTETFDTDNNFASSTFTPTKAGYYSLNILVLNTTTADQNLYWYVNGASVRRVTNRFGNTNTLNDTYLVYLNGTTDYVEMYFYGNSAGTLFGGSSFTVFSGVWIRS